MTFLGLPHFYSLSLLPFLASGTEKGGPGQLSKCQSSLIRLPVVFPERRIAIEVLTENSCRVNPRAAVGLLTAIHLVRGFCF